MSGETTQFQAASLGSITDPGSFGLPEFCRNYTLRREPDGRLFAVNDQQGCTIFVLPNRWKDQAMPMKPAGDAAAINYGVSMPALHQQMSGTLQTNDPDFGPAAMGRPTSTTASVACRDGAATAQPYLMPAAIVAGAVIIGLFARRFRGQ